MCPCEHTNSEDVNDDIEDMLCWGGGFDRGLMKQLWLRKPERFICKGCKCVNHKCVLFNACEPCAMGHQPDDEEIAGRLFMNADKTLEEVAEFMDVHLESTIRELTTKPFSCPLKRKCMECKHILEYDEAHVSPEALDSVELNASKFACEPCVTLRGLAQGAPSLPPDLVNLAYDYLAPPTVSQKRRRACGGCQRSSKRRKLSVHTCQSSATLVAPQ